MKTTFKNGITSVTVSGSSVTVTCKDTSSRNAVHSKIINNQSNLGKYSKCSLSSNAVTYTFASSAEANSFVAKINEVRELWKNQIISGVTKVEIYSKDWVKFTCHSKEIGMVVEPIIRAKIPALGFSYIKYADGGNKKDFRYQFSSSVEAARFATVISDIRNGKEVPVAMPFEEVAKDTTLRQPTATTTAATATTPVKQTLPRATTTTGGNVVLTTETPSGSQSSVEVTQENLQKAQEKEAEKKKAEETATNGISQKTLLIAGGAAVLVIVLLVIILKR